MPFEPGMIFVIIIVAIIAGTTMVASIVKHATGYYRSKSSGGGGEDSLTSSELRRLIQHAVEEATQPLEEEVRALRKQFEARSGATLSDAEARRLLEEGDPTDAPSER